MVASLSSCWYLLYMIYYFDLPVNEIAFIRFLIALTKTIVRSELFHFMKIHLKFCNCSFDIVRWNNIFECMKLDHFIIVKKKGDSIQLLCYWKDIHPSRPPLRIENLLFSLEMIKSQFPVIIMSFWMFFPYILKISSVKTFDNMCIRRQVCRTTYHVQKRSQYEYIINKCTMHVKTFNV